MGSATPYAFKMKTLPLAWK